MATYSKTYLSGSSHGQPIQMGTSPVTIHTCAAGTTGKDELFILACNNDSVARKLTLNVGGSSADKQVVVTLNAYEGLVIVIPGLPLDNAVVIQGFGEVAGVINVMGHVLLQT